MTEYLFDTKSASNEKAIKHFKESVLSGNHWYIALLESIGMWSSPDEIYNGQTYQYLLSGELFDWLLLAERLCAEIRDLLPEREIVDLLFYAQPPFDVPMEEFTRLIGETKYRAYLNYFYGVVVEAVLVLAVEEEIYKEQRTFPVFHEVNIEQEAYKRIYGADMSTLLQSFKKERNSPLNKYHFNLKEQKEFTYWLFKYRIEHCEKARVASDTRKALQYLRNQWSIRSGKKIIQPL